LVIFNGPGPSDRLDELEACGLGRQCNTEA